MQKTNKNKSTTHVQKVKLEQPMIKKQDYFSPGSISLLPHIYRGQGKLGVPGTKVYDLAIQNLSISTTATIFPIFLPAQGVALNQRDGDICFMEEIEIIYTCNAANTDIFSNLRIVILQWYPNDAIAAPTAANIFQTSTDGVYSVLDYGYSDQFRIIYDQLHSFSGTATNPTMSSNQSVHKVIKSSQFRSRVQFITGTTNGSGKLYFLSVSDSSIAPEPGLIFKSRVSFATEN